MIPEQFQRVAPGIEDRQSKLALDMLQKSVIPSFDLISAESQFQIA